MIIQTESFANVFSRRALIAASALALATGFSASIAPPLFAVCSGLFVIAWLLSAHWPQKWAALRASPAALWSLAAFAMYWLYMPFSAADTRAALKWIGENRNVLLVPLFASLALTAHWRRRALWALAAALLLTLLLSYVSLLPGVPPWKGREAGMVFANRSSQGMFFTIAGFMAYTFALSAWRLGLQRRTLWLTLLGAAFHVNVLYFCAGRSALVTFPFVALFFIFAFWRKQPRALLRALLLLALVLGVVALTSSYLQKRLGELHHEAARYEENHEHTSTGERMEFYRNGLALMVKAPVFGYGTASILPVYRQHLHTQGGSEDWATRSLHNQFFNWFFQFGALGLLLWLIVLWRYWQCASADTDASGIAPFVLLVRLTLITYLFSGLFNTPMETAYEAYFFFCVMGLFSTQSQRAA